MTGIWSLGHRFCRLAAQGSRTRGPPKHIQVDLDASVQTMQFVGEELEESCCYGSCDEMVQAAAVVVVVIIIIVVVVVTVVVVVVEAAIVVAVVVAAMGHADQQKIFRIKKINQDQKNI